MKIHEIDFESGREFKRSTTVKFKAIDGKLYMKLDYAKWWSPVMSVYIEDLQADDWEYCEEMSEGEQKEVDIRYSLGRDGGSRDWYKINGRWYHCVTMDSSNRYIDGVLQVAVE